MYIYIGKKKIHIHLSLCINISIIENRNVNLHIFLLFNFIVTMNNNMYSLKEIQPLPLNIETGSTRMTYTHKIEETEKKSIINCFSRKKKKKVEATLINNEEKYRIGQAPNEETLETTHSYIALTFYSVGISLAGLVFGYDIGTIGAIIDMPAFVSKFGDKLDSTTPEFYPITKGILLGVGSLGGCIGGLLTKAMVPAFGPRTTLFLSGLTSSLGDIIILLSKNWLQVTVGRAVYGIGCGIICVVCPMLISDLSPTNKRGLFISIIQLHVTIGIIIGALTMLISDIQFSPNVSSHWQYSYPVLQGILFGIITCAVIFFIPESPTWLLSKGRQNFDKAAKSLARCSQLAESSTIVQTQTENIAVLMASVEDDQDSLLEKLNKSLLRGQPKYLLRTITGIILSCLQQFTGINYFFFFSVVMFKTVGVNNPYIVPIFFGSVNVIFSLLSVLLIARFQRLTLLKLGSFFLALTMCVFTTLGLTFSESNTGAIMMIMASCIFVAIFATTWGPLVSIIISELYPHSIKVKAMAICGCAGWISTFLVSFMIPILTKVIGFALGYIFCVFIVFSIAFIYYFVPETRHVEISALDAIYEANIYPRKLF